MNAKEASIFLREQMDVNVSAWTLCEWARKEQIPHIRRNSRRIDFQRNKLVRFFESKMKGPL